MADQQQPTETAPSTEQMMVETTTTTPASSTLEEPQAKRVRFEEPTQANNNNTQVTPLGGTNPAAPRKAINFGVDINTLSMADMREEMAGIVNLATELKTSIHELGLDEQTHYFAMVKGLKDRHDTANKYMQQIRDDSNYNKADVETWIDMMRANDMDARSKDSIASFAAANQRYATKKVEDMRVERDAAIKRAHDFEAQLECLKKDGGSKQQQQQQVTNFSQQPEQKGLQQPVFHSQTTTTKAVDTYYNQFGTGLSNPFGSAYDVSKSNLSSLMSQHIMKHLNNQENAVNPEKRIKVDAHGAPILGGR